MNKTMSIPPQTSLASKGGSKKYDKTSPMLAWGNEGDILAIFYILLCLLFSPTEIKSNDYSIEIISKSSDSYSGDIKCGMEDSRGFIWLGTSNGLFRYDGKDFISFAHNTHDTNSISNNLVEHIVEDKEGFIWGNNEKGEVNRLNPFTGKFQQYLICDSADQGLSIVTMRPFVDITGQIWYSGFFRNENRWFLSYFNFEKRKFEYYDFNNEYIDSVYKYGESIPQFISGKNGDILLDSRIYYKSNKFDTTISDNGEYRILVFNPKNKTNKLIKYPNNFNWMKFIATDGKGNALFIVWKHDNPFGSVIKLNLSNYEYTETNFRIDNKWFNDDIIFTPSYFDNQLFLTIKVNESNEDLINLSGFYQFDENDFIPYGTKNRIHPISKISRVKFFYYRNKFYGKTNNIIWDYFSDELIKIYPRSKKVKTKQLPNERKNNSSVRAIHVDSDNIIWLGTNDGIYKYSEKEGFNKFRNPSKSPNNNNNKINDIKEFDIDNLILATDMGIWIFNKKSQRFRNYNSIYSIKLFDYWMLNAFIKCQYYDKEDKWFGALVGLRKHENSDSEYKVFMPDDSIYTSISDYVINCIYKDKNSNIWVGTSDGLNLFLPDSQKFKVYRNIFIDTNSLYGNNISSIKEDENGNLWVTSYGYGLNKYNPSKDHFTRFGKEEGIPELNIVSIEFDKDSNIWMGSSSGLIKYNPYTQRSHIFRKQDGFQGNEYLPNSSAISKSGMIYFGGTEGMSCFNPSEIKLNQYIPEIVISKLFINDSLVSYYQSDGDTIKINWKQDYIKIYFAALNYISPENNEYAFLIEDVHNDWVHLGNNNSFVISGLDPGSYVIRLKGSNNDGIWNEEGIKVYLIVEPPYWMTWWFRTIVFLILAAIIFVIVHQKYRQKIDKEKTEKKLFHYKMISLQSQMNPHFIFNSLNSLLNLILSDESEKAMTYITNFSRLLRKIFENSRTEYTNLESEIELIEYYLTLEQLRFDEKFEYEVSNPNNLPLSEILIPSMLIQPYVENSIKHGFSNIEYKGKILINIDEKNGLLLINIKDNGIGREKSQNIKSKSISKKESLGIKISEERLKLLDSSVKIIDNYDIDGIASGTEIQLKIKIINNE
jgi:ligand-binding sensor domain-containing protein/two-component sensor histidine kinase